MGGSLGWSASTRPPSSPRGSSSPATARSPGPGGTTRACWSSSTWPDPRSAWTRRSTVVTSSRCSWPASRSATRPYFEEVGHIVDAADPLLADPGLAAVLAAAHRALGFTDGITHAEFKLTGDGPVVIEVNARLGGDLIPYLGMRASGIDPGLAAAAVACGQRPQLRPDRSRSPGCASSYPSATTPSSARSASTPPRCPRRPTWRWGWPSRGTSCRRRPRAPCPAGSRSPPCWRYGAGLPAALDAAQAALIIEPA